MTLGRWAARRLLLAVPVVLGITTLTFTLIHLAPGDPIYLLAGDGGSASYYADMRAKFGLDRPVPEQFARYALAVLTGDFGYSFTYQLPVSSIIAQHAFASILLGGTALVLAVVNGTSLALIAAFNRGRTIDAAIRVASAVMYSAPVFWIGQILIIVAAVQWGWFPVAGMTSARDSLQGFDLVRDVSRHLVLPAVALSLPFTAIVARLVRASLIDAIDEPFVQAARARGLSQRQAVIRHAAPHAAVTLATLAGQHAPQLVAGAAITEYLFAWPGLGAVVLHASLHRDYPLVTSAFLVISIVVVSSNAITDAVCAWLDPRVRFL